MKSFSKKASLCLIAVMMAAASASARTMKALSFDWDPVMDAIIQVESEGNPNAVSGKSAGAMQITPILVEDCNDILKKMKSKKRFTLADRFSVAKSKEMFLLIQMYYNPTNDIEKAIRIWNGGIHYSVRATNRYYRKVTALMS